jgi:hypothetical protein
MRIWDQVGVAAFWGCTLQLNRISGCHHLLGGDQFLHERPGLGKCVIGRPHQQTAGIGGEGGGMTENPKQNPTPPVGNRLRYGVRGGDPRTAPRCGARTRAYTPCKGPAMPNGRWQDAWRRQHRPTDAGGAATDRTGAHRAWRLWSRDAGAAQVDAGSGRGTAACARAGEVGATPRALDFRRDGLPEGADYIGRGMREIPSVTCHDVGPGTAPLVRRHCARRCRKRIRGVLDDMPCVGLSSQWRTIRTLCEIPWRHFLNPDAPRAPSAEFDK